MDKKVMKEMTFMGYRRPDGRVGIRNKVLILPASVCASDTTRIIASQVENAVTFNNQNGCSQVPSDQQFTMDVMAGYAANPNVYGTVVISLGCENCQMDLVLDAIRERTNKPLEHFIIQENGGTIATIEKAVRAARQMTMDASMLAQEAFGMSELIIGTECGGSDPTSGLASNVLIGEISDRMAEIGGTSILSETTEFIGAEHILAKRGKDERVSQRIYQIVHDYENAIRLVGHDVREGNPSPGNMEGGLTTLEEKSLGCIHKAGSSIINEVVEYGAPIKEKGLVVMDTPGQDIASILGMAAAGAQAVIFSTGHGTPTGSAILPVIKLTANRETAEKMADNTDFDCSGVLEGLCSMENAGAELFDMVEEVCNGRRTKAEELGFQDVSMARYCNFA